MDVPTHTVLATTAVTARAIFSIDGEQVDPERGELAIRRPDGTIDRRPLEDCERAGMGVYVTTIDTDSLPGARRVEAFGTGPLAARDSAGFAVLPSLASAGLL